MLTIDTKRKLVGAQTFITTKAGNKKVVVREVNTSVPENNLVSDITAAILELHNDRVRLMVFIAGFISARINAGGTALYCQQLSDSKLIGADKLGIVHHMDAHGELEHAFCVAVMEIWHNKDKDRDTQHYKEVLHRIITKYLTINKFPLLTKIFNYA